MSLINCIQTPNQSMGSSQLKVSQTQRSNIDPYFAYIEKPQSLKQQRQRFQSQWTQQVKLEVKINKQNFKPLKQSNLLDNKVCKAQTVSISRNKTPKIKGKKKLMNPLRRQLKRIYDIN